MCNHLLSTCCHLGSAQEKSKTNYLIYAGLKLGSDISELSVSRFFGRGWVGEDKHTRVDVAITYPWLLPRAP